MAQHPIVEAAEAYVRELLSENLSADLHYHHLTHTLAVQEACKQIAAKVELTEEEKEVLELAALFHDTGFTQIYEGHEKVSQEIVKTFLAQYDYPAKRLELVLACIEATYPPNTPVTLLEKIIRDADMFHLSSEDYLKYTEDLRYEWSIFLDENYSDSEWSNLNYKFVKSHIYYTEAAQELFGPQKEKNLKTLKKMGKQGKKKKKEITIPDISSNRSAQMMFKTALRNHLDLSNLADNKANIMLSVNALIITVALPVVGTYVSNNEYLLAPMISMLVTCLVSMIFATFTVRPIKMGGYTDWEKIKAGEANLFFFGNFYRMTYNEYQDGMQQVVSDKDSLESAIMRDLYFLGRSLGIKYRQLRICYTVFMFGIIITVITFAISYGVFILQSS